MKDPRKFLAAALVAAAFSGAVAAKVTPEETARLGNELTCVGAERAGNADGSIPEFTGKHLAQVPGWKHTRYSGDHPIDPYADEKPLFSITAQNMAQYAARLTDGQKAMFAKYPDTFRMDVYPGHRDYRYPDYICDRARHNALNAELLEGGLALSPDTIGQVPFPIPKDGFELIWNVMFPVRQYSYEYTTDSFVVLPNGTLSRGRYLSRILAPSNDPANDPVVGKLEKSSYTWGEAILPDSERGQITVTQDAFDYKALPRIGWQYNPGTRRVRQIPGTGFDQPLPGTNGAVLIDDVRLFNGSPERFQWNKLGKREVYIPINSYRVATSNVKYADLLTPGHANPDYIRYELRRVWVVEAVLKPEYRHAYARRVLYVDEDTWHAVVADAYDGRGELWKHSFTNYYYEPHTPAFWSAATFYHDLNSGRYSAADLTNEQRRAIQVFEPGTLNAGQFTPDAVRAAGR